MLNIGYHHTEPSETLYAIILDEDGNFWSTVTNMFEAFATYADYDIVLTEADGYYYAASLAFDAGNEGMYAIRIYKQVGGSPVLADDKLLTVRGIAWDGENEITIDSDDEDDSNNFDDLRELMLRVINKKSRDR